MPAKYAFTEKLAELLAPALAAADLDFKIRINPEDDDVFDDSVDDEIVFEMPDGKTSNLRVQSGPHGIGLNEDLFDPAREYEGVRHGRSFDADMLDAFVSSAVEQLKEAHAPVSPAP